MVITATELKKNLGHYIDNIEDDVIFISKNGKIVAELKGTMPGIRSGDRRVAKKVAAKDATSPKAKTSWHPKTSPWDEVAGILKGIPNYDEICALNPHDFDQYVRGMRLRDQYADLA